MADNMNNEQEIEDINKSRLFEVHKLYFQDLESIINGELKLLNSENYNLEKAKETSDLVKNYIDLIRQNFYLLENTLSNKREDNYKLRKDIEDDYETPF